jgi:hypothetical protein
VKNNEMKRPATGRLHLIVSLAAALIFFAGGITSGLAQQQQFRPPAVPLVTHDPYFSVWSMADKLTDERPRHWTGASNGMAGMARIDGKTYRFMGQWGESASAMKQVSLQVLPTRSIYEFEAGGVWIALTFISPLLPHDLDVMSRPTTYVTWDVRSVDNQTHQVSLYFDCTSEWVVNTSNERVIWARHKVGDLTVLSLGSQRQAMLEKSGDDLRIDWGYLYLVIPPHGPSSTSISPGRTARASFSATGALADTDDLRMPRPAREEMPVLAAVMDLGAVGTSPVSRHLILAYDDQFSVEYFNRRLRPYWRRNGMEADALLKTAERDYVPLSERCKAFDDELMADLRKVGGEDYARLAALAFRQTIAANKLTADFDRSARFFSKENFSNGSIDTVDVTYPSAPFFLLFNPRLLKAQLTPIFEYAASGRWPWPYAPHDLGTYPLANGQTYGGGEKSEENQMPVEESGNMLIMTAALAKVDGNADYARLYWPLLTKWAEYLRDKGMDPENQLSTDDFAGHLAHNTNLSLKAILALGSYALLADLLGQKSDGARYREIAQGMAKRWVEMADDGDHYRLSFDRPGTWSQKYNLVWDRLLGLNLLPSQVSRREINFYKTKQNKFGLPLDNRETYTKLDWIVWTATLAESTEDFKAFVGPAYRFVNETPNRVPLTDWFWTLDGKQRGFQARSVVGGVYIKMLADASMWKKWSGRARSLASISDGNINSGMSH